MDQKQTDFVSPFLPPLRLPPSLSSICTNAYSLTLRKSRINFYVTSPIISLFAHAKIQHTWKHIGTFFKTDCKQTVPGRTQKRKKKKQKSDSCEKQKREKTRENVRKREERIRSVRNESRAWRPNENSGPTGIVRSHIHVFKLFETQNTCIR